jgi:hypothetical protein
VLYNQNYVQNAPRMPWMTDRSEFFPQPQQMAPGVAMMFEQQWLPPQVQAQVTKQHLRETEKK